MRVLFVYLNDRRFPPAGDACSHIRTVVSFLNDCSDGDIIPDLAVREGRAMPKVLSSEQVAAFERDGFVAPVRAISAQRALYYRRCLEDFETTYPDHRLKLDQKAHMICPWVDEMIREPGILDAAEDLIGPNILCWGTSLRAKAADGKTFAGWHQDTAYADVKPIVVIVALALSPSRPENGCIRGVPRSNPAKLPCSTMPSSTVPTQISAMIAASFSCSR